MKNKTPYVSIIMRSKNSDWVIDQALSALYSQNYKDFELIIVDSGSTDKTLEIVKQYPCRLFQIDPSEYFPGKVLNDAIKKARGEIIVFQNSDVVPLGPKTLGRLISTFQKPAVMAAFCRQVPRPEAKSWVRCDYAKSFPVCEKAPSWITLSLPMAAMRKNVWEKHPFYTEAWASEDTEWGHWAKTNGHEIKYVSNAAVMHSHNYSLKQLHGRRYVEGEADAFIYKRKYPIIKLIQCYVRSCVQDIWWQCKHFDFLDMLFIPLRRLVYHLSYYKGHRFGEKRRDQKNVDMSTGQNIVLNLHS